MAGSCTLAERQPVSEIVGGSRSLKDRLVDATRVASLRTCCPTSRNVCKATRQELAKKQDGNAFKASLSPVVEPTGHQHRLTAMSS